MYPVVADIYKKNNKHVAFYYNNLTAAKSDKNVYNCFVFLPDW